MSTGVIPSGPSGVAYSMTQVELLLLVTALTGIYMVRWTLKLAPVTNELPVKTLIATGLSGVIGGRVLFGYQLGDTFTALTLALGPAYVFAPMVLVGLARARRFESVSVLTRLLYWLPEGRAAAFRLLAQVALQQGEGEAAQRLNVDGDLLLKAQALALQKRWQAVLDLDLPDRGELGFLSGETRVEALLGLGRLAQAEQVVLRMQAVFQKRLGEAGTPAGHRALVISEARLMAERGDVISVQRRMETPLPGVAPHLRYGIVARAAEQRGDLVMALQLYAQAYTQAPEGTRRGYAEVLTRYGQPLPSVELRRRPPAGTLALTGALVAAFVVQLALDQGMGGGRVMRPSTAAAAFLLNVAGVPAAEALWRYLSHAFVHGGLIHIGFNAWVLFDIGRLLERRRSWGDLVASFVVGTAAGAALTALAQSGTQLALVGASGGVLGVAGALLVDASGGSLRSDRSLTRSLLQWMALLMIFSLAIPNVSLWAHVGGVLGGAAWGLLRRGLLRGRGTGTVVGVFGLLLLAYALLEVGIFVFRHLL